MALAACCGCRETPATANRFPARNSATLEGIIAIEPFGGGLQLNRGGTDLPNLVQRSFQSRGTEGRSCVGKARSLRKDTGPSQNCLRLLRSHPRENDEGPPCRIRVRSTHNYWNNAALISLAASCVTGCWAIVNW